MSAVAGVLFICLGFGTTASGQPVDFSLTDQLGDGELSEQVTVLVDGKKVGNLTVNGEYPVSPLRVTVPQASPHSYTAEATASFDVQGQYTGAGQGMINVEHGKVYSL